MKLGSKVSVGHYIWKSMIPCVIGNTLSAAFFLAGSYAMCYVSLFFLYISLAAAQFVCRPNSCQR